MKAGIVTVSDRGSRGERKDTSGPALKKILEENGFDVIECKIVPDEFDEIVSILKQWCDMGIELILTTGGTGFSPRDITPEATRKVIEREAPGISELIRQEGLKSTRNSVLSRGISGICRKSLIINLPGSERGAKESLNAIVDILPHALELISGKVSDCGKD